MKFVVAMILLLGTALPAKADVVDVGPGTIQSLEGFKHQRRQGRDTAVGEITNASGKLVIRYEIGAMAGASMEAGRKADCVWYREQVVGGHKVCSGLVKNGAGRDLLVTVTRIDGKKDGERAFPANFAAAVVTEEDIADTLLTAVSYAGKR